jgi:hypothetical protein
MIPYSEDLFCKTLQLTLVVTTATDSSQNSVELQQFKVLPSILLHSLATYIRKSKTIRQELLPENNSAAFC